MPNSIQNFIVEYTETPFRYGIPSFQRQFTWEESRIEAFFDSIANEFPIPRFFIWSVNRVRNNGEFGQAFPVKLSKFIENFQKPYVSINYRKEDYDTTHKIVCDGQQRLTSLIVGFKGVNFGGNGKTLYFNPLISYNELNHDGKLENKVHFKFLTPEKSTQLNNKQKIIDGELRREALWMKVSTLYEIFLNNNINARQRDIELYFRQCLNIVDPNLSLDLSTYQNAYAIEKTQRFLTTIVKDDYLNMAELGNVILGNEGDIIDFFIRINLGAKPLKKAELMFSIVAGDVSKENFNLRNEFDLLLNNYFGRGKLFERTIEYDYLLRVCIYILCEKLIWKPDAFRESGVADHFATTWPQIKTSIEKVFSWIKFIQFEKGISSFNSLIPIFYHFFKKSNEVSNEEKNELLRYLISAQFSSVFSSHGDTILNILKDNQLNRYQEVEDYKFSFNDLTLNMPTDKSFKIDKNKIEKLLETEYQSKNNLDRALLFLIYGFDTFNNTYNYDVDHIHPKSICSEEDTIKSQGQVFDQAIISIILKNYNKLPNLQILERKCNINKNNILFDRWLTTKQNGGDLSCLNGQATIKLYLDSIFADTNETENYEEFIKLNSFRDFYSNRKNNLRKKLYDIFEIPEELGEQ